MSEKPMSESAPIESQKEYGPELPRQSQVLEVYKNHGKGESFEVAFSLWRNRAEALADRETDVFIRSVEALRIDMLTVEIKAETDDKDLAKELMIDIEYRWSKITDQYNLFSSGDVSQELEDDASDRMYELQDCVLYLRKILAEEN